MSTLFKLPSLADVLTANPSTTMTKAAPESSLLELPTELLVQIFWSAPSLEDAAHLAAANKQLRAIWFQHMTAIYNNVAPASIPAYSALRDLLVDRELIPRKPSTITLDYIGHMVRGTRIGKDLVKAYNANEEANQSQDPQVSTQLSETEEPRFVRAMYQLLGLLTLDNDKQYKRIKKMDLKTQFLLSDFFCVFCPHQLTGPEFSSFIATDYDTHYNLHRSLRSRRNRAFYKLYEQGYRPINYTTFQSGGRYAWWCDRHQETFKAMLTGRVFRDRDGKVDMSKVRDDMWYDSDEE